MLLACRTRLRSDARRMETCTCRRAPGACPRVELPRCSAICSVRSIELDLALLWADVAVPTRASEEAAEYAY